MTDPKTHAPAPAVPEDVAKIVAELREWDHCWPAKWLEGAVTNAADALEAQAAELARLTMALAETEALEMQHGAVIARLTAERDALAKEKSEFAQWRREETERAVKAEAERDALRAACNQARLAFAGDVSAQSAINMLDALTPTGD